LASLAFELGLFAFEVGWSILAVFATVYPPWRVAFSEGFSEHSILVIKVRAL